jgi:LacI family transcriptional regulator
VARDLGYQPNAAARALVTGKTGMVAVWVPNAYRPIFSSVIEAVLANPALGTDRVVISQVRRSVNVDAERDLNDWHVDGIIGHDARIQIEQYLDATHGPAPVVSTGPAYSTRCDCVGVDLYQGSYLAVEHLFQIGCRKIVYVSVDWAAHIGDERYRAYTDLCEEYGIEPKIVTFSKVSRKDVRLILAEYLSSRPPLDALFCFNDEVAIAASIAARDAGMKVPDDFAIIGSDGIEELEYHFPAISTVAQPLEQMADIAWKYLRNRMEDPTRAPQQMVLPMTLIKRQSTAR